MANQFWYDDYLHTRHCFAREHYDLLVDALRVLRHDVRKQAEFLNVLTEDLAYRLIYPELPTIMFRYVNILSYKRFDDLSKSERDRVIEFFSRFETYFEADPAKLSEEDVRNIRASWPPEKL